MLRVERRVLSGTPTDVLSLPYDERKKSRLRARSEAGHEVAIVLERGTSLRHGDLLAADSGEILLVRAAAESVSDVTSADAVSLAKAAYHLGNRHVPLQIERGALRYQHDHVLDAMVLALGLQVTPRTAAFEPEGGAYAGHSHGPGHSAHSHAHAHADDQLGHDGHSHSHADHQRGHDGHPRSLAHSHADDERGRDGHPRSHAHSHADDELGHDGHPRSHAHSHADDELGHDGHPRSHAEGGAL